MMHGDPTWPIPDGNNMMEFAAQMYEEPEVLNEQSARRTEAALENARKLHEEGHLLDGFGLCADYCFNANPFFSCDSFDELIVPYLKEVLAGYREMGYYSIKHSDGNIMPILKQIADCKPDAIHSLDPQGGVSLTEARKIVGDNIALCGNVNCGLLQTGTEEEARQDTIRALDEGMASGKGFIFCTSNCAYTGMPLDRYELMNNIWRERGNYDLK
jgi:uroporphyrinogen decarboxylase